MQEQAPAPRTVLVHDKFVERWATRYLEIREKHGGPAADTWANTFLNKDDVPRIAAVVRRIITK